MNDVEKLIKEIDELYEILDYCPFLTYSDVEMISKRFEVSRNECKKLGPDYEKYEFKEM